MIQEITHEINKLMVQERNHSSVNPSEFSIGYMAAASAIRQLVLKTAAKHGMVGKEIENNGL
jgi:hypothetical protein